MAPTEIFQGKMWSRIYDESCTNDLRQLIEAVAELGFGTQLTKYTLAPLARVPRRWNFDRITTRKLLQKRLVSTCYLLSTSSLHTSLISTVRWRPTALTGTSSTACSGPHHLLDCMPLRKLSFAKVPLTTLQSLSTHSLQASGAVMQSGRQK